MNKKWIIIILVILIIGVIIWLISKQKEKYFKPIAIENNNIFNRVSNKTYLDTIAYAGIKSLNLQGLIIVIKPLTDEVKNNFSSEFDLKAYIIGQDDTYIIYVDTNLSKSEYISTFSHELIHLEQYYTKKLIMNNNIPIWKGEQMNLNNIKYQDRPWEIEAFSKQRDLEQKMNNFLY